MSTRGADEAPAANGAEGTTSVVAGIDRGPLAGAVLRAAAEEALRRDVALDLVAVVGPSPALDDAHRWTPARSGPGLPGPGADLDSAPGWPEAIRRLAEAADQAEATWPQLEVRTWCVAQDELRDSATAVGLPAAERLVVGARGRNRTPAFGLRSVSRLLAKRFAAPVLVVPVSLPPPAAPVVVGLRDRRDVEVLRSAVAESALRGAPLVVVLVLGGPADPGPHGVLDDVAVPPGTRVIAVTSEPAAAALARVAVAEDAQLLVIGTDGPASLAGLAHESTSRAVIRLSSRPVLLVPPHAEEGNRVTPV